MAAVSYRRTPRAPASSWVWAAASCGYAMASGGLAAAAARLRYLRYSRELGARGSPLARSFVLEVARQAALVRAVEVFAAAALVYAIIWASANVWKGPGRRAGGGGDVEGGG